MVDRQVVPAQVFRLAQGVQQFKRIDIVTYARVRIDVFQGIDLERAPFFAGDDAARFIWRVSFRLGD